MKSMTYERAAVRQAPYMARTAQTPYIRPAPGVRRRPPIYDRRGELPLYRLLLPAVLKGSGLSVSVSPLSQREYRMSLLLLCYRY